MSELVAGGQPALASAGIRRVPPLSAGMFVLGLDAYVLSGVLGNISADLHVTIASAGQMVTAFTLSYALLSPVASGISFPVGVRGLSVSGRSDHDVTPASADRIIDRPLPATSASSVCRRMCSWPPWTLCALLPLPAVFQWRTARGAGG